MPKRDLCFARQPANDYEEISMSFRLFRGAEPLTSRPVLDIVRRFHKSGVNRVL